MNNDDTLLLAKTLHEAAYKAVGSVFIGTQGVNSYKFDPLSDSTCVALQTKFQLHTAPYYSDRGYSASWMPIQVADIRKPVRAIADTINEAVASVVLAIIKGRE